MNDNIASTYPEWLPCRLGCYISSKYAEDCEYYEEEMDMGARIPICMKTLRRINSENCNEACKDYKSICINRLTKAIQNR